MKSWKLTLATRIILQALLGTALANLVDYVDPLIGSGGGNGLGSFAAANLNPGAQAPFSLLRLGPDTTFISSDGTALWLGHDHISGYSYNDTHVLAFSHTHVQGGGCGDLGNFGVALSASADIASLVAGSSGYGDAPYKTPLVHGDGERASPGWYSLVLPGIGAVELVSAGTHTGIHRYNCSSIHCTLLLDVCHNTHSGGCPAANASYLATSISNRTRAEFAINASVLDSGYFAQQGNGVWVHTHAALSITSAAAPAAGLWSARRPLPSGPGGATAASDTSGSVGFYVSVPGPAVFEIRVGLSLVSVAGAVANLEAEQRTGGNWATLEALHNRTARAWEVLLGQVHLGSSMDDSAFRPAAPRACAPPVFDPSYVSQLPAYFAEAGNIGWLQRQGLPLNATGDAIARHIWALSCYAPPALDAAGWRTVLYTALYHALCAPTTVSDADGSYIGLDGAVHAAEVGVGLGVHFSDLSLWDIHRTQAPLFSLLYPAASATLSASLLAMARQAHGILPRWPFASVETRIMCADHSIAVLADAVLKGVPGVDAAAAWAAANSTLAKRDNSTAYATLGWVPIEESHGYCRGGSLTLEFAFDDAAAAALARAAGDLPAAAALAARSHSYAHMWSPAASALCPRHANGTLECTAAALVAPFPFEHYWTEADGAQMAWFVPGDPAGLADLYASPSAFLATWEALLAATPAWPFGTFMPNAAMWMGNEPSLLIPWQAAWAPPTGAAHVQRATRELLRMYYTTRFDGVPGNDDYGTMSAGAVWALLGLYPLAGTDLYILGSPTFANVTLGGAARTLTILAHNATTTNIYVESATLNGDRLPTPFVRHADLLGAPARLEFVMTDQPTPWG